MKSIVKRCFDIVVSLFGLIFFGPLFVLIAIIVYFKMGRPVLFKQDRPGMNGEIFRMYKFRTMRDGFDKAGNVLPDAERLTGFGDFLRASSLDELPELINVLKGEMSLVGPRPLLVRYLERYSAEQMRRHEAKPGITGWAQVNGRNAISWTQKFSYDVWYVDNHSFWLDMKILFMTFFKVFKKEGISSDSHVTMEEFMGNGNQSQGSD